ncbi:hypothetical protein [Candidatus Phytoplasma citri]|uniref:Uncharacterized protein n=1 Tax=Candidatus Phytoplasma citri TaxID=180978 RepID=A0ABU8ZR75_9MOLU|nr:hypothetical protein [Candidatus Phytoplasma aurantifolia]MDO8060035.1 hypothetical protein [Candidatus Phytoplasma aurantifolia]MDO8078849.1 hypothetical protein [Candidatus Phytoplasma aurantifolia]
MTLIGQKKRVIYYLFNGIKEGFDIMSTTVSPETKLSRTLNRIQYRSSNGCF